MPLQDLGRLAAQTLEGGCSFQMTDGANDVIVWVSMEAVMDILPTAPDASVARFQAVRASLAAIASDKFDRKDTAPDGSVWVRQRDVI